MIIFVLFSALFYLIYFISTRKFNYWETKKVPHLKPIPLLGNYGKHLLQLESIGLTLQKICQKFPKEPYIGAFYGTEPALIVQDPELIKTILTKEFSHFSGREISNHSFKDPFGLSVFGASGDRWKVLRQNLTPLFSAAKMKNMYHLILNCSYTLEQSLDKIVLASKSINMYSLSKDFNLTCFLSCSFGVDANILENENKFNPIRNTADLIFHVSIQRMIKFHLRAIWPTIFYGLGLTVFPPQILLLTELVKNVLKERNYKPSSRNDFIDLLMGWIEDGEISGDGIRRDNKEARRVSLKVDDDILLAQCLIIFAAGFESSSLTISHTLFELAKHKEAQKLVHAEIDSFLLKHGNNLAYECVSELPFLEACTEEALRLYPVLGMVTREVMEDFTLPTGVRLEKNLRIHIPVYNLHHHPEYFPKPEEFRPERFLGEAKKEVNPYTFMPFGEGTRICLGKRFGKMQMFACLVKILKKYQVELAEGMSPTLHLHPRALATVTGDVNLNLTLRDGWERRQFRK